jgi:uncharacterized repeat protein (TIGR02543 family)
VQGSLVKTGFTFLGWSEDPAAAVASHTPSATITGISKDYNFHAVWKADPTYTVTYSANGGIGTAPTDSTKYKSGDSVTVKGKGVLSRSGYTFLGWSTNSGASAATYTPGDDFIIRGNVNLYAVWDKDDDTRPPADTTYSVTYRGNGNTGGSAPTDGSSYKSGSTVTVKGQSGLTRTGYTFLGWSTDSEAVSAAYTGGSSFSISGDVTLYAVWRQNTPTEPPVVTPVVTTPALTDPDPESGTEPEPIQTTDPEPTEKAIPEPEEPDAPTGTDISVVPGAGFSAADRAKLDAQTGNLFGDLWRGYIPVGNFHGRGAWSLLSLILSLIAVIVSAMLLIGAFANRKRRNGVEYYVEGGEKTGEQKRRANILRSLTVLAGILTAVVWLILDDFTLPIVWINRWTSVVGIIFIVHIVLLIVFNVRHNNEQQDDVDEAEYNAG